MRAHFLDGKAQPATGAGGGVQEGELFPQPTMCLMEEGDVCLTMHAIPHSGTRNEGTEPRANMIWRIRAKSRQPGFYEGLLSLSFSNLLYIENTYSYNKCQ